MMNSNRANLRAVPRRRFVYGWLNHNPGSPRYYCIIFDTINDKYVDAEANTRKRLSIFYDCIVNGKVISEGIAEYLESIIKIHIKYKYKMISDETAELSAMSNARQKIKEKFEFFTNELKIEEVELSKMPLCIQGDMQETDNADEMIFGNREAVDGKMPPSFKLTLSQIYFQKGASSFNGTEFKELIGTLLSSTSTTEIFDAAVGILTRFVTCKESVKQLIDKYIYEMNELTSASTMLEGKLFQVRATAQSATAIKPPDAQIIITPSANSIMVMPEQGSQQNFSLDMHGVRLGHHLGSELDLAELLIQLGKQLKGQALQPTVALSKPL